jgi:hypothetical protein
VRRLQLSVSSYVACLLVCRVGGAPALDMLPSIGEVQATGCASPFPGDVLCADQPMKEQRFDPLIPYHSTAYVLDTLSYRTNMVQVRDFMDLASGKTAALLMFRTLNFSNIPSSEGFQAYEPEMH